MRQLVIAHAEQGTEFALRIAPHDTGEYAAPIRVENGGLGGWRRDRAMALVVAEAPHSAALEFGIDAHPGYHVLSRTRESPSPARSPTAPRTATDTTTAADTIEVNACAITWTQFGQAAVTSSWSWGTSRSPAAAPTAPVLPDILTPRKSRRRVRLLHPAGSHTVSRRRRHVRRDIHPPLPARS
jgi:hypothetical protein